MTIAILLSGNGVYDGSELHETVFTIAAIDAHGASWLCLAPNVPQMHVINHVDGSTANEQRNVLVESARVARGSIADVATARADDFDALVIPGGFGAAKNLTTWAIDGPGATIQADVERLVLDFVRANKPVVALCMAPVVIAKALEGAGRTPHLTVGSTAEASPYDIAAIAAGIEQTGGRAHESTIREITIDASNHIITAPCYMMEARPHEVRANVEQAINAMFAMLQPDHE